MAEQTIPSLATRSSRGWFYGTAAAVAVLVAYLAVTRPADAPFGVGVALVLGVGGAVLLSTRVHLDVDAGTLTRTRWLTRTRRARLDEADSVRLVDNRGGGLNLTVRSPQGTVLVPVLLLSSYVRASQAPPVLRSLAGALEQHAAGSGEVAGLLRSQAAHLDQGGDAASSPLASLTSRRYVP